MRISNKVKWFIIDEYQTVTMVAMYGSPKQKYYSTVRVYKSFDGYFLKSEMVFNQNYYRLLKQLLNDVKQGNRKDNEL